MRDRPDSNIADKKLVFIVGAGRSGTNWLRRLLSQSPNVATGPETHLFSSYLRSASDSWSQFHGSDVGLSHLLSEAELVAWMRSLAEMTLGRMAEKRPKAKIVLEKTPNHGNRAVEMLRIFPDCSFIHILRDPRAVVSSLRAASRSWGSAWAPGHLRDACRMWRKDMLRARGIGALTPRYCEVSYENLHADGVGEIMRLFEFLGEPVARAEAEAYVAAASFDKLRAKRAPALTAEDVDKQVFRRGEVDSWRRELSGSDIAMVERLTRKQMAQLGYIPVADPKDRAIAAMRLGAYVSANRFAKAVRAGADRLKP